MNDLERISYFGRVWSGMLPHIPAPQPEDIGRWINFDDRSVMMGLLRVARKFPASTVASGFDPTNAYRYATGTIKSISAQKQKRVGQ